MKGHEGGGVSVVGARPRCDIALQVVDLLNSFRAMPLDELFKGVQPLSAARNHELKDVYTKQGQI